ncbi:MAG TPA: ABC-2 family transporter protein [Actinoplanes sp.]|nr:ABC-2 family transporter protein [Actinoplanes sp.]
MSYRTSFAVELLSNLAATALDVLAVLVLFRVTRTVGGFALPEALLMVALSSLSFAAADLLVGNIDRLKSYVRLGAMDAVLLRPLSAFGQLVVMDLPLRKVSRVLVSTGVLVTALHLAHIQWTPARVALVLLAPVAGALFFASIFVTSASLAFWWVESGEVGNAFTYGGRDFTAYPISVYRGWFRALFAYGLGFGFVAYHPALALLGRADPLGLPGWVGWASPSVALVAVGLAVLVWRLGIRHYRSTGS